MLIFEKCSTAPRLHTPLPRGHLDCPVLMAPQYLNPALDVCHDVCVGGCTSKRVLRAQNLTSEIHRNCLSTPSWRRPSMLNSSLLSPRNGLPEHWPFLSICLEAIVLKALFNHRRQRCRGPDPQCLTCRGPSMCWTPRPNDSHAVTPMMHYFRHITATRHCLPLL